MYFVTFILKNLFRRPIRTALTVLGLAVAVGSMVALLGVTHNVERSVEAAFDSRRVDLVVMQKGKPMGLDSDFSEYFVQKTAEMPEVDRVSEGVVGPVNVLRPNGTVDDTIILVQGWKSDNFGYEDLHIIEGRKLRDDDRHKVLLGRILAGNLKKGVGKVTGNTKMEAEGESEQQSAQAKREVKGAANQVKGSVKEGLGKVTGDDETRARGTADRIKGDAQRTP